MSWKSLVYYPVIFEVCPEDRHVSIGIAVAMSPKDQRGGAFLGINYNPDEGLSFDFLWLGLWG